MKSEKPSVLPVLLGADLNCYNIARAFHEAYGVVSYAFGRYSIGATEYTRILRFTAVAKMDEPETMVKVLTEFAAAHPDEKKFLLGCTDAYVTLITDNRAKLEGDYIIPYASSDLIRRITQKAEFYRLCEEHGIPYPRTVVLERGEALPELPFGYPIIIKPSSSVLYWQYPFDGMKKVYRAKDRDEAADIISSIYASGYPDRLILQDTIPGDDSRMYVLTAYSGRDGKVKMMCLGHVLLEEHTPKGLGNHAAIVTEYNEELMLRYKALLESIGYTGYANFDIKYDERDGSFRTFEINTRLGRSNYYITAAGNNPAKTLVGDYIDGSLGDELRLSREEIYWRYVPDKVVFTFVKGELAERVRRLLREKKAYSSMRYDYDLRMNPRRRFFIFMHEHNHVKKFRKYYKIEGNES